MGKLPDIQWFPAARIEVARFGGQVYIRGLSPRMSLRQTAVPDTYLTESILSYERSRVADRIRTRNGDDQTPASAIRDGYYTFNVGGSDVRFLGFRLDDLADFVNSAVLGAAFNNSLASRLGEALGTEDDALSRAIVWMLDSSRVYSVFVADVFRSALVNPHLLKKANLSRTT